MIRTSVVCVVLAAIAFGGYWYFGHRPIAYHNECIGSAIGNAMQLEVSLVPKIGAGGELIVSKPPMRITDRSQIDRVLGSFLLPWYVRASGSFHECGGHMEIMIYMPDSKRHLVRFDHGIGIYPIARGDLSPGFSKLSKSACSSLVEYFISLGYSRKDLGIAEGEQAVPSDGHKPSGRVPPDGPIAPADAH